VCLLPILLDPEAWTLGLILSMLVTFILCAGLIIWSVLGIKYVFEEDHLYVQGGPFRSCIPYEAITKVEKTGNFLIGYRILSARRGLEIFYKTGMWGSVIIS